MGFAGMERETVTGLNLAVNRVQNPGTGRWGSPDPDEFAAGDTNLYRYAFNTPSGLTDPLGLDVWVEGPAESEPFGHRSVSVGDPNGDYFSISFGCNGIGFTLTGLTGTVYEDKSHGGDFIPGYYYKTSREVDDIIKAKMQQLIKENKNKGYRYSPHNNCNTWSYQQFKLFAKELEKHKKGQKATPPKKFAGPDPIDDPIED